MAAGTLRNDDPELAADHLGALLEAEVLEPLLSRRETERANAAELLARQHRHPFAVP